MMTKKLSLSHIIMGKIAMVTPESLVAKSILKINQSADFYLKYFSLGRRTTTPRSRRGKASLSSLAHNSSPGWRRWGILQLVLMFLFQLFFQTALIFLFSIISVSGGGGGGRLVGCGCCGDIARNLLHHVEPRFRLLLSHKAGPPCVDTITDDYCQTLDLFKSDKKWN